MIAAKPVRSNRIRRSMPERIFGVCNNVLLVCLAFVCLYPMLYVVFASFSNATAVSMSHGFLWRPAGFSLGGYKLVFENPSFLTGYYNTFIYVFGGTAINLFLSSLGAYVLSRKHLIIRKPLTILIMITMYFSGGMVPSFLNMRDLGLLNSRWAVLLCGAISTYNMLILRTAFVSIPASLEECAMLDGAGDVTILFRIILPLSVASFAVVGMYYAVDHWNSWFSAMIYLDDRRKYPLQLILREILITGDLQTMSNAEELIDATSDSTYNAYKVVKYCSIVVATVPILVIYPFVQRYFVKGVMVGSVKG